VIRELAGLFLGIDVPTIDADLEDAARTGLEDQALEAILIVVRDFFRQTDGFREVPSSSAVLDLELHDVTSNCSPIRESRPAPQPAAGISHLRMQEARQASA
jgi:hypothetical protein